MIDALPASGLPTLSQIQGWQTAHLRSAARRWRLTADTWTSIYDDIAADLSAKSEIVWEGDASTAAQARTKRDRDTVELLAERLYFGASIAESGAAMVDQAKEEALLVVRVAGALAFDVREDLSLVDRLATGSPAATAVRLQQSNVLAATVRVGAAQLVSTDHAVAQRLREALNDCEKLQTTSIVSTLLGTRSSNRSPPIPTSTTSGPASPRASRRTLERTWFKVFSSVVQSDQPAALSWASWEVR